MRRRDFLQTVTAGATILLLPAGWLSAGILSPGHDVSFRCLGNINGPRFLDGHTADGSVGLAPSLAKHFSGTRWHVFSGGGGSIALKCMGSVEGNRWLDGRTQDGSVGLAPSTNRPFTGTRWQVVPLDANNQDIVGVKCLGEIPGPMWLDGRTGNGTVGLTRTTEPPSTGTRWEVRFYPVRID
jgi:hypothetical protein